MAASGDAHDIAERLTEKLGIKHPVLLVPMGNIAGGRLAAAVSKAGGLGLIGGGYGDEDWLEREFGAVGNQRVGCGFITWSLAKKPHLLDLVLAYQPTALMLSFGDPNVTGAAVKRVKRALKVQKFQLRNGGKDL